MEQLFKYHGTVSSIGFSSKGCGAADLILSDITDRDKPPVRVDAHGALARYINEIEMTDAEERYIRSDWYYDSNLFLYRIEVPGSKEVFRQRSSRRQTFSLISWRSSDRRIISKRIHRSL